MCDTRWRDPNGEHQCRHDEGHTNRRHSCTCGSWPGEPGSAPLNSLATSRTERPVEVEAGGALGMSQRPTIAT